MNNHNNYEYKVGGSLPPTALCYVERKADLQLATALKKGEFCYVLNSRQMGKSSLKARTMQLLEAEGFACAAVDVTKLGTKQVNADRWYKGLVVELARVFGLNRKFDLKVWRNELSDLSALQQLSLFIEDILLTKLDNSRICIFLEEIDNVKSLEFSTDDLFGLIRSCYEQRVHNSAYERLTFCLLGVAAPSDLITDKHRTPFNIGKSIDLTGFTLTESRSALTPGLSQFTDPDRVLADILEWTGGQPFLTQKLCKLVAKSTPSGRPDIDKIVRKSIVDNWETQDTPPHLKTIRDRLKGIKERQVRLLSLYQNILINGEIEVNDSSEQSELLLSGLVVKDNGKLKVYNRLYKTVFDRVWVERELIALRPDYYSVALAGWLLSNRTEESWLLRGKILQKAQQWAADKSLSDDDYKFLDASRKSEQEEIQRQRDVEAENARILGEANLTLADANHKAKQRIQIGGVILFGSLVAAGFIYNQAQILTHKLEIREINSFSTEAKVYLKDNRELEGLLTAVKAGKLLQRTKNVDDKTQKSVRAVLDKAVFQTNEQNRFEGHNGEIRRIRFSRDGKTIVTASSEDGKIIIWNRAGEKIRQFSKPNRLFRSVSFTPDEKMLAAIDDRYNITFWDLEGKEILDIEEGNPESNFMADFCFIDGGKRIVSPARYNQIKIRNSADGKTIKILKGKDAPAWGLACSDLHQIIVMGERIGKVNIWDFNYRQLRSFTASNQAIFGVALSPDGTTIATAAGNGTWTIWDLAGQQKLKSKLNAHDNYLTSISFSTDGQKLVTTSSDKTAKLWSTKTGQELKSFKGHDGEVFAASFSNDGKTLATTTGDGIVYVWNLSEIDRQNAIGHQSSLWAVDFNPIFPYFLATAGDDRKIKLWDSSGAEIRSFPAPSNLDWNRIWNLQFSPNGKMIATANDDKHIRLFDLQGHNLRTWIAHQERFRGLSFSPNGQLLASSSHDGSLKLWNLEGRELKTIVTKAGIMWGVTFDPQGKILASAHEDGSVRLWNLEGKLLDRRPIHDNYVTAVSFSPDGKILASGSADKTLRLWHLETNKVRTLRGHNTGVTQVSFSPDGKQVASASDDYTIRIWDVNSGEELRNIQGESYSVWNVKYHPDGKTLAAVNDKGTLQIWNAQTPNLDELITKGCQWMGDYLKHNPKLKDSDRQIC